MEFFIKMEESCSPKVECPFFSSLLDQMASISNQILDQQSSDFQLESHPTITTERMAVQQLANYLDYKNTPISILLQSISKYFPSAEFDQSQLSSLIRRKKLALKRQHAKQRRQNIILTEVKVEQGDMSACMDMNGDIFLHDEESLETKKKKRNRISAQNSRDRKKQHLKEIQGQNQILRQQLRQIKQKQQLLQQEIFRLKQKQPSNNQFIKILVFLGVACFINTHSNTAIMPNTVSTPQDSTDEEKTPFSSLQGIPHPEHYDLKLSAYGNILDIANFVDSDARLQTQQALNQLGILEQNCIEGYFNKTPFMQTILQQLNPFGVSKH